LNQRNRFVNLDATFDAGILAVGGSYIGVAWFEAED